MISQIKNIVFDIGNVLVRFEPITWLVRTYPEEPEKIVLLHEHVFGGEEWKLLDKGQISPDEAAELVIRRIPDFRSDVLLILRQWEDFLIEEIPASVFFLKRFRMEGYRIFALSNYPERAFHNTLKKYDFLDLFDGRVISFECGMTKPDLRIYDFLLKKYELIAEESVFIDDLLPNVDAAESLGFRTVHFTHPNRLLKLYLELGHG